jgi:hypothetical protein
MLIFVEGQLPLGLAKELSCAAVSSLPPSILELQHRLCTMTEIAIGPSVGCSFVAATP